MARLKKYEVEVDITYSVSVTVEAEDEYEAKDLGEEAATYVPLNGMNADVHAWDARIIEE